jgi:hypothetical protein
VTTICRHCGGPAIAERSASGLFTGHWHHTSRGYTGTVGRPHNVEPEPEALSRLRQALFAERPTGSRLLAARPADR